MKHKLGESILKKTQIDVNSDEFMKVKDNNAQA